LLPWLGGVLQNSIRGLDSLGRIGGEEFLVVAPNTDSTGAAVLAERLRENVALGSTIYNGQTINLTISLGLAVVDANVTVVHDLLRECAAAALKEAKESGRNKAVIRLITQRTEQV
jgi:diguanylate cyclase (GGDEF)-like protein